ncbi:Tol-Pal system beta propeller repeat protein TolB [Caulobacter sp. DWR1-3-2b1]|uniref:Tol-Pal system beta propeller repeat protein TolB n=1 Tax=Caulobacter sp. DWR1-3-2b1 TaxID=2804670 RepID=UPI003CE7B15E
MRLKALLLMVAALVGGAMIAGPAAAQIEVDINAGAVKPLPIAVPAFSGTPRGAEIAQVITGNLERSGLFQPLNVAAVADKLPDVNVQPRFPDWQATGAQALINGQVTVGADGGLRVDFRLWDVFSQQQLLGLQFSSTPDNWRRVAHKISDAVYERLTGEKGYFDTRVAFVAESGPKVARVKRLAIMDQDGANPQFLTDGSYIVMTPRFSATSQELTYMALRPTGSSIYLLNLETSRQETVGKFPGMVFAPRFSPDGRKVAFSVEKGGNSDIYVLDLRSRNSVRITTDPAIDTSPSFSPDGSKIVFNSDRGGQAQLYMMNADGSGVRRISYGGGRYTTPVWSPRGDFIAFTKQSSGRFHIGVMRTDGSDERLLTTSYLDEGPTWAPNGRVLMYFRETQSGTPRLWTVDITGRILRPAAYQGQASDPAWSPLLD